MMVRLSYLNVAPLVGVHKQVHCVVVMRYGLKRRDRFARRGKPGYPFSLALQSPRGKWIKLSLGLDCDFLLLDTHFKFDQRKKSTARTSQ